MSHYLALYSGITTPANVHMAHLSCPLTAAPQAGLLTGSPGLTSQCVLRLLFLLQGKAGTRLWLKAGGREEQAAA